MPLDLGKYRVQTTSINDNLMEYALLIEDVQKEDMGPYVCRLISDFHLESENEVWISFRGENHQCKFPIIIQLHTYHSLISCFKGGKRLGGLYYYRSTPLTSSKS